MRTLLSALLLIAAAPLSAQDAALLRHFDYDQKAPLEVHELGIEMRGAVAIHDISYLSPKGGRVPAYLVVPSGRGPFAGVIWGHWYMPGSEFLTGANSRAAALRANSSMETRPARMNGMGMRL